MEAVIEGVAKAVKEGTYTEYVIQSPNIFMPIIVTVLPRWDIQIPLNTPCYLKLQYVYANITKWTDFEGCEHTYKYDAIYVLKCIEIPVTVPNKIQLTYDKKRKLSNSIEEDQGQDREKTFHGYSSVESN